MPTETQLPDAILEQSGWSATPAVTSIDEDPDTTGADWIDPAIASGSGTSSPVVRVSFPTPSGNPTGVQTFKARLGQTVSGGTSPTARIDLYENGALVASGTNTTISTLKSAGGQVLSQTFNLSTTPLGTINGSLVEARVVITASGGSNTSKRSASLNAVDWDIVNYGTGFTGYAAAVMADTPSVYWRLGEAAGASSVADTSGNARSGTPSNVTLGVPGGVVGDPSTAASFTPPSLSRITSGYAPFSGAITLEAIVKTDDYASANNKVIIGSAGANPVQFLIAPTGAVDLFYNGINSVLWNGAWTPIGDNAWTHVVLTFDPASTANCHLYLNGTDQGVPTGSAGAYGATPGNFQVGANTSAGVSWFGGDIDEVAIYPAVLTPTRVTAHFQASGLTAILGPELRLKWDVLALRNDGYILQESAFKILLESSGSLLGEGAVGITFQEARPDADIAAAGWTVTPLWSKINDQDDATLISDTLA